MKIIEEPENLYEIQFARVKNLCKEIPEEELNKLKDKVLSCIDSADMREYLSENFEKLNTHDLIGIVGGALRSINFKLNLFTELAEILPHQFDEIDSFYDFEPYVDMYKLAFKDMQFNETEKGIFLLNQYDYKYERGLGPSPVMTKPFYTFNAAIKYIKNDVKDWLNTDDMESALTYFGIEKWVGDTDLEEKSYYTVSKYGEIWHYYSCESDCFHLFGYDDLNLPVPFKAGDIITLDCRPFIPLSHVVVVSVGDNHDCCSVQCIYFRSDGTIDMGALKHSAVFDAGFDPEVSPLYKATITREPLPDSENIFYDISNEIRRIAESTNNPDDERYPFVYRLANDLIIKTTTPGEFLDSLKNIS